MWVAVNRPYAMGAMLYDRPNENKAAAFRFILERKFDGVILTGTKSPQHLRENRDAFESARKELAGRGITNPGTSGVRDASTP